MLAVACAPAETSGDRVQADRLDPARGLYGGVRVGSPAPEFSGLGPWLNSGPLTLDGLNAEGRVVLVDFWTYTCVNCLRTLPFLRDWDAKYHDRGLTIVGVHTPEFLFERNPENVARAVSVEELRYPVAQDDHRATWNAFHNNVWPAKYLVDVDGRVVYRHFGEGDYAETEEAIRAALVAAGHRVDDIALGGVEEPALDPHTAGVTRELYFGYVRNVFPSSVYAAQRAYYDSVDEVRTYEDPGGPRLNGFWYVHGSWLNEREAIVHVPDSAVGESYIAFRFVARTVNPVLHPGHGGASTVVVTLDGAPLTPAQAGPDVTFEGGRSIVVVDQPRMYRVVELDAVHDGDLRLATADGGLALFAVTFGAYTEGP